MTLPSLSITLANGQLKQTTQTDDGVAGLIMTGVAVSGKIQLHTPELITSVTSAEALGITAAGTNAFAHNQISKFYEEAGSGAELYIMISDQLPSAMALKTGVIAPALLDYAKGRIRILGIVGNSTGGESVENGLSSDVPTAAANLQALKEEYFTKVKPFVGILDAANYNNTPGDLSGLTIEANSVQLFMGSDDSTSDNSDLGSILGRYAANPVQRKASRVASGKVKGIDEAYLGITHSTEAKESDWGAISNAGLVFLRTWPRKAGYFFSSDQTMAADGDDYDSVAAVRTINKAYLLAYGTLLEYISDEVQIDAKTGKIPLSVIKSWQSDVETTLGNQMGALGEISGAQCLIDPDQDVITTNKIVGKLRIVRVGYSDAIEVDLGYTIKTV